MVEVVAAPTTAVVAADDDDNDSNDDDDSFHYNQIYSRPTMIDSSSCSSHTIDVLDLVVAALL